MKPQQIIEEAWEGLVHPQEVASTIEEVIDMLDRGEIAVISRSREGWVVNEWVKKAILLYFGVKKATEMEFRGFTYIDKVPLKKISSEMRVRVVPGAIVRKGAYIGEEAVIMPSFINIGAHVGKRTMVDTWATVGSCAWVGDNVHIAGGAGIGGVLEPPQAKPVIIENNVFVGSRAIIVEGVHVKEGAVIGAGTILTASTRIIDARTGKVYRGEVPPNSVVISASMKRETEAGEFFTPCALIIGTRSERTDHKTAINELLREWGGHI